MDCTVITIEGFPTTLKKLNATFLKNKGNSFSYTGFYNLPDVLKLVPDEGRSLLADLGLEKGIVLKYLSTISVQSTFRNWLISLLCYLDEHHPEVKVKTQPDLDMTHSIFDRRLVDLDEELLFQKKLRPHKSLIDIYGVLTGTLIEIYLTHRLFLLHGTWSKNEWLDKYRGTHYDSKIVEQEMDYGKQQYSYVSYCIHTVSGTPWGFFKYLSELYPDLKITVSESDIIRSIIQLKIYRDGKIVTTMTTEDTTILKQLHNHTQRVFGGTYFYLPLHG